MPALGHREGKEGSPKTNSSQAQDPGLRDALPIFILPLQSLGLLSAQGLGMHTCCVMRREPGERGLI